MLLVALPIGGGDRRNKPIDVGHDGSPSVRMVQRGDLWFRGSAHKLVLANDHPLRCAKIRATFTDRLSCGDPRSDALQRVRTELFLAGGAPMQSLAALWGSSPTMAEERIQRRLAAILATDVVGYSRMMGTD